MFVCLSVNHAETTERILVKFGIHTGYELTWVIGYVLSHENASEAAVRSSSKSNSVQADRSTLIL
uniref:SFRICE_020693 n=1 Tax=Spodoptera frugiperda TaxID=7108 RepID=A0A2H1VXW5_SPOFR